MMRRDIRAWRWGGWWGAVLWASALFGAEAETIAPSTHAEEEKTSARKLVPGVRSTPVGFNESIYATRPELRAHFAYSHPTDQEALSRRLLRGDGDVSREVASWGTEWVPPDPKAMVSPKEFAPWLKSMENIPPPPSDAPRFRARMTGRLAVEVANGAVSGVFLLLDDASRFAALLATSSGTPDLSEWEALHGKHVAVEGVFRAGESVSTSECQHDINTDTGMSIFALTVVTHRRFALERLGKVVVLGDSLPLPFVGVEVMGRLEKTDAVDYPWRLVLPDRCFLVDWMETRSSWWKEREFRKLGAPRDTINPTDPSPTPDKKENDEEEEYKPVSPFAALASGERVEVTGMFSWHPVFKQAESRLRLLYGDDSVKIVPPSTPDAVSIPSTRTLAPKIITVVGRVTPTDKDDLFLLYSTPAPWWIDWSAWPAEAGDPPPEGSVGVFYGEHQSTPAPGRIKIMGWKPEPSMPTWEFAPEPKEETHPGAYVLEMAGFLRCVNDADPAAGPLDEEELLAELKAMDRTEDLVAINQSVANGTLPKRVIWDIESGDVRFRLEFGKGRVAPPTWQDGLPVRVTGGLTDRHAGEGLRVRHWVPVDPLPNGLSVPPRGERGGRE